MGLSRRAIICIVVVAFALGSIVGWLLPFSSPLSVAQQILSYRGALLRQDDSGYSLIAPLLACDIGSEDAFPELSPLKAKLTSLIAEEVQSDNASRVSIYIRTLKGAHWLEINGTQTYAPASLLKVFVMMAYYKEADESNNPEVLTEQVAFEGSPNPSADTPGQVIPHLTSGKYYSVEQIIEQMIIYSDNDALNTLVDHFDTQTLGYFEQLFHDLGIPSPVTQKESDLNFMSVDEYALIFRVLYGATYLTEPYSQKALEILSQAQYQSGIVAGVPEGLQVAHKFGVTTVPAQGSAPAINELHDCGIVYYPNHPYLLCIMTEGKSFATLQTSIEDISSAAYQWLDQYYKSLPSSTASSSPTR